MSHILCSVVVPSHHRPEFLKRTLLGLENQSLAKQKFEVIVVLSPNDSSFSWLNDYKTSLQLKFLSPVEDKWQGRNVSFKRNYGASLGEGRWIAFTDDDCIPHNDWLANAAKYIDAPNIFGIEGCTVTPGDSPHTLTWKGLQRLANSGGYQTCNIFYRKEVFTELTRGFDSVNFPWFLEDTDLAWSVLDAGKQIVYEPGCLVTHPVGPRASWRLIHEAKGAGLKVRLFNKHPEQYEVKKMKTLRGSQYLYLFLLIAIAISLISMMWALSALLLLLLLKFLAAHMTKLFWKLNFSLSEVFEVAWRTVASPPIALWSLWREKQKSGLALSKFFKLLKP